MEADNFDIQHLGFPIRNLDCAQLPDLGLDSCRNI
jgi:hypothetical protein